MMKQPLPYLKTFLQHYSLEYRIIKEIIKIIINVIPLNIEPGEGQRVIHQKIVNKTKATINVPSNGLNALFHFLTTQIIIKNNRGGAIIKGIMKIYPQISPSA
ncbi:MAG: hypothetical protein AABW71_02350 [Nanoarchaeota archaeon]